MDADLCLDFGCKLETDNPKPLIKVINYVLNYLKPLTTEQLQVGLNLQAENFRVSFLALTETNDVPPFSDKLADALTIYNAEPQFVHEAGKYIQVVLVFRIQEVISIRLDRVLVVVGSQLQRRL